MATTKKSGQSSNLTRFGDYTPEMREEVNKEAEKVARGGLKLEPGLNVIVRFAPIPDAKAPFVTTFIHWLVLPDGKKRPIPCPRQLASKPCPECEYVQKRLPKVKNDADRRALFSRQPNITFYSNVIIGGADADPQIVKEFNYWDNFRQKLDSMIDDNNGVSPWHITKGYDVKIRVPSGKGKNSRDATVVAVAKGESAPLDPDGPWVMQTKTFAEHIRIYTPDEMLAIMEGDGEAGSSGRRTSAKQLGSKRSVSDDVEDEDVDEDDDEEDEDEDDDDENEDEDKDDDEDEDKDEDDD